MYLRIDRPIERIGLVDPTTSHDKWKISTHSIREPLGLECIGAVLKENGYHVQIFQQQQMSEDELVGRIMEFNPQVIGFTAYSYNFHRALKLAEKIKKRNTSVLTIFGGYHATFCLDEVRKPCVDFIVRGEGELTVLSLLNSLNNKDRIEDIEGIVYLDNNQVKITSDRDRIRNLDAFPFALRDENILRNLRVDGLMYPPPSKQKNAALIFASRGCPYSCYYCASPGFYGSYVSYRSPEKVVEEIKYLNEKFETNTLYFTDLTFNLNRNYVKRLCNKIIQKNLRVSWYALCRPDILDEETIKLMKKAGCTKIGFGIESVSEDILKHLNRKTEIEKLKEMFQMVSSYGIIVRGNLMFGFPWDTKDIYASTLQVLKTLPIDEVRVAIFSPYPGTEFFKRYKHYILSFDYKRYNSQTPLVRLKNISSAELIQYLSATYKDFYLSRNYKLRMEQKIKNHPELKESYKEFWKSLAEDNFL